jgi:hypothetical protein
MSDDAVRVRYLRLDNELDTDTDAVRRRYFVLCTFNCMHISTEKVLITS